MSDATPQEPTAVTEPLPADQTAGARTAAIDADPSISQAEADRGAAGEAPNAAGGPAPSTVEEHVPSMSAPYATDIPSANAPDPTAVNPETNPNSALQPRSTESASQMD